MDRFAGKPQPHRRRNHRYRFPQPHGQQPHSLNDGASGGTTGTTSSTRTHIHIITYLAGLQAEVRLQQPVNQATHTTIQVTRRQRKPQPQLTNKPPYVRSLMLRDSGGTQQDLGALLSNTSDSQFDLYTLSGGSGSGTTGSAGTHSQPIRQTYTRGVATQLKWRQLHHRRRIS